MWLFGCVNANHRRYLYSIKDINTHCLQQFNTHWQCLENNNHRLWECRKDEVELNKCVFDQLVRYSLPYTRHRPQWLVLADTYIIWPVDSETNLTCARKNRASRRLFPEPPRTSPPCISDLSSCMLLSPDRNIKQPLQCKRLVIIRENKCSANGCCGSPVSFISFAVISLVSWSGFDRDVFMYILALGMSFFFLCVKTNVRWK